jgi:hypothetical protein
MRPRTDDATRTIIQSEIFPDVLYECKKNHLIIHGGKNGTLAISFEAINDAINEMLEIKQVYEYGR